MFHFAKPWRGLRLLTRVKVFCRFNSEFRWNSTLYGAGIFGTGYTSTHTQVNIQKTNYTLRRLHFSCHVRRSTRSFVQLLFWARNLSASHLCHTGLSFSGTTIPCIIMNRFHQIFISSTMGLSTLLLLLIFYCEWRYNRITWICFCTVQSYCSDITPVQSFLYS